MHSDSSPATGWRPFHRNPRPSDRFSVDYSFMRSLYCILSHYTNHARYHTRVSQSALSVSRERKESWTETGRSREANEKHAPHAFERNEQDRVPHRTDGSLVTRASEDSEDNDFPHRGCIRPSCAVPLSPRTDAFYAGTLYHQPSLLLYTSPPWCLLSVQPPPPCNLTLAVGRRKGAFLKRKGDRMFESF